MTHISQLLEERTGLAGAATLAAKLGEGGGFMSVFNKLTPSRALSGVSGNLAGLASSANFSPATLLGKVKGVIDANESRAEYVAAAIDIGTNVFEHTGIQTVARRVVTRAYDEL